MLTREKIRTRNLIHSFFTCLLSFTLAEIHSSWGEPFSRLRNTSVKHRITLDYWCQRSAFFCDCGRKMGHFLCGAERKKLSLNVHLHCIVSHFKTMSKMSTLPTPWKNFCGRPCSGVTSPSFCRAKHLGGAKCLILGEQQHFVWDAAAQTQNY